MIASDENLLFASTRRPTKRAPDAGESGAIPSLFLRLIIFSVGRRPTARPSAGIPKGRGQDANRWAAGTFDDMSWMRKARSCFGYRNLPSVKDLYSPND